GQVPAPHRLPQLRRRPASIGHRLTTTRAAAACDLRVRARLAAGAVAASRWEGWRLLAIE
ncbi:MAG TPA: hypothetical protein VFD49_21525, partial [Candidatus Dormibacteraeota bacterium]|nr:hypothetical protein [Candidatus Dormibacteraeota bacterium]